MDNHVESLDDWSFGYYYHWHPRGHLTIMRRSSAARTIMRPTTLIEYWKNNNIFRPALRFPVVMWLNYDITNVLYMPEKQVCLSRVTLIPHRSKDLGS